MVFNTGLFQSNKQTAMNGYFIKNLNNKGEKIFKFRQFTLSGYRAGK